MKRLLALLLFSLALPACQDALAQVVRPQATPRTAAAARSAATLGRLPEAGAGPPTTNLVLHLQADTGIYEDAAGTDAAETADRARSWTDQSVNAYVFVESGAGGSYPVYVASDTVAGYGSIQFASGGSPANQWLRKTGVTDLVPSGLAVTMGFIAGKAGSNGSLFSQDEGGGNTDKWIVENGWVGGGIHLNGPVAGAANLGGALGLHTSLFNAWVFRRKTDGTWEWRKDGVVVSSGTSAINFSSPNTGAISIGEAEGNVGDYRLSELTVYDGAVSDTDLSTLETYLVERK